MRRYERQQVTVERETLVESRCDGCGAPEREFGRLIQVAIEVNLGEEFGRRDEYDYCDDCLIKHGPALLAAGSRSELVGGIGREADDGDNRG